MIPASSSADQKTKKELSVSFKIDYKDLTFGPEIGRGYFGIVYKGTWKKDIDVAIKQLFSNDLSSEANEEFDTETQTMVRLRHKNIIQFYGYCISPQYCIVMEHMLGGSLFSVLRSKQPLEWIIRIRIALDMAAGLAYLHQEKILHRDIKSLNVLLDETGRAKLSDFGLSKVKSETKSIVAATKTNTNKDSVGTIQWMAPELFKLSAVYTQKSDVYSFGITLWELATRKIPYEGAPDVVIKDAVKDGERDRIPSDCPAKLASLIQACWEGAPDKRPDAGAILTYLRSDKTDFTQFLSLSTQAGALPINSGYQGNFDSNTGTAAVASAYPGNFDSVVSQLSPVQVTVPPVPNPVKPPILNQFQNQRVPADVKVSAETNNFLKLVADGEQDDAEKLLKSNPNLALGSGNVTDLAGRSFKNITAFQYAVWALDWHMWSMIRKYLPTEKAKEQLQAMKDGSWVKEHSDSASWQNLLDALQKYIDLYKASKWDESKTQWKKVRSAQWLLPVHVVNEYCHPGRSFASCPDFTTKESLPRIRITNVGEWYTVLGESFAYVRGRALGNTPHLLPPRAYTGVSWADVGDVRDLDRDRKACHALLHTRTQQHDQLFIELSQPADIKVTGETLSTFLMLIADGEQDDAEKLLKSNQDLALASGNVTDLASRSFKNITAFQYAVWALDWHMWTMIRKYLPTEKAKEQLQGMKDSAWVKEHGDSASWQNLLDALQKLTGQIYDSKLDEVQNQWQKQIGYAQRLLPAHVVNEYCRPDRPFHPCPDFTEKSFFTKKVPLPRTRNTYEGEWYTATYNNGKLGESFAYLRYSLKSAQAEHIVQPNQERYSAEQKACRALLNTRTQQRDQLFAELSVQAQRKAVR